MSKAAAWTCLLLLLSGEPAAAQGGSARAPREEAADTWIFSETQSPLDYAPVIIASAWSYADSQGRGMQLSIQCRRGRTDVALLSPDLAGRLDAARVSYAVDGAAPAVLAAGPTAAGNGIAIKGDVVRLLVSLPARGEVVFRVAAQGEPLEGHYALPALDAVLNRLAAPCKWPARTN